MVSSSAISNYVNQLQTATAQQKLEEQKANGVKQEMDKDAFLMLMMEQLKYQDPTEPMDNTQFLAQQAQFTQLEELMELNDSIGLNNQVSQACGLIGKEVAIQDPDDETKIITGIVDMANFTGDSATIVIGGSEYPLNLVKAVANQTPSATNTQSQPQTIATE